MAIAIGYMIFTASLRVNLKKFFNVTSVLLILFAAGLVGHGVHELQEAEVIPVLNEHVWDINPDAPLAEQGIYPALHEKGGLGSFATGLFGYNGNPSLLEIIAYLGYIVIVFVLYRRFSLPTTQRTDYK